METPGGGDPSRTEAKDTDPLEATPEAAARHCELYCALCTKHRALLRDLLVVFGECKGVGRAAIMRNAEGLARVLGPAAPALIALIDDTPPASTSLLLRMLNFLTETQIPPQVQADCLQCYLLHPSGSTSYFSHAVPIKGRNMLFAMCKFSRPCNWKLLPSI